MNYLKIAIGVLIALSVSRFIPHPPNFTSLIALSFYLPVLFGRKSIPLVVISLAITDFFIGFHSVILFTWGSVIIIGLTAKLFIKSTFSRLIGSLIGAVIFFIVSNFGVWLLGSYGYTINGLLNCYLMAIPFFSYTLISTIIFSTIIESIFKLKFAKFVFKNIN